MLPVIRRKIISHLIYCPFNEPFYLDIVNSIAQDLLLKNEKVIILQPTSPKSDVEFYSSKILRFFRKTEPNLLFANNISKLGIQVYNEDAKTRNFGDFIPVLEENNEFQLSLNSSLISFYSDSGPFISQRHRFKRNKFEKIARKVFWQTLEVFNFDQDITDIYIPNGRFVDQKAFHLAAEMVKPGIRKHFFERGFRENMYYLGDNSLHDRVAIQTVIVNSSKSSLTFEAANWFDSRKLNRDANEFIFKWETNERDSDSNHARKLAVLFNSSNDEFVSLGPIWNDSEWKSQWEAFSFVTEKLLQLEYEIVVRLHPNGLNKSRREKSRERKQINAFKNLYPNIKVYEPGEQANSYSLIQQADLVVVWNSTIGLEASHMGKPVVCLNAAEWDNSISVLSIKSLQDLVKLEIDQPIMDFTLPAKFISGRMEMDSQLLSDFYTKYFIDLENRYITYRLAKYCGGAKPFDLRVIIKVLFKNRENWIYRALRKLNHKFKTLG